MAPRAVLCVVALVAILSSTASASRLFSGVEDFAWKAISLAGAHKEVAHTESSALSVTQLTSSLEALVSGVEGPFDGPVHVTAEFFPAPTTHHAFVMEFGRMAEMVRHCGAKVAVHLTKPMGDNIKFVAYMYAEDGMQFRKMIMCEGLRDFMRFLGDRNIPVMHQRLIKLGAAGFHATPAEGSLDAVMAAGSAEGSMADLGCSAAELAAAEHNQAEAAAAEIEAGEEAAEVDAEGRPMRTFRMLTLYQVPPGAGKKFTRAWKKLACKVGGWKGSRGLALYSVMGANTYYVSYAAWEPSRHPSKKDREEKMKVFHAFKEEVEDMGVSFRAKPLFAIERPAH